MSKGDADVDKTKENTPTDDSTPITMASMKLFMESFKTTMIASDEKCVNITHSQWRRSI